MFVPLPYGPGHRPVRLRQSGGGGWRRGAHGELLRAGPTQQLRLFREGLSGETTEASLDCHVSAFAFLGGIPQSILYDNIKLTVASILGRSRREHTSAFTELQSNYLLEDRFGRPGQGNDKGNVDGMVDYARRNFLVPVPRADGRRAQGTHRDHWPEDGAGPRGGGTAARWEATKPADGRTTWVSPLSLVRYRTSDNSVPVAYGHRTCCSKATWTSRMPLPDVIASPAGHGGSPGPAPAATPFALPH